MSTPSPALRHKIAQARANARADLPLVRACARVVDSLRGSQNQLDGALADLKTGFGTFWSLTTAVQLMSGRRGKFAAECAPEDERDSLYETHLFAEALYAEKELSGPAATTEAAMAGWRDLAQRLKQEIPPAQQP